ncbi:MurR/RpiR family transcriptional regulator [Pseudophaeobacter sp. EL27]|uniref:MurR/RpiR family transcriptional regulator n=1 Tax=Pseudophaeobacter sp. EL27 TaxID=2107580 RepID=UPI000EFC4ED0|nr:MurR/RpiR family transcriptional regulator [Pseudophaeobacter sp. EL27]
MDPHLDPKQTARLIAALKEQIAQMPAKLALAAKYIIDNPGSFALDPVRDTAHKAGISANSFVRLADRLGYDSFEALRHPFRDALITTNESHLGAGWLDQMAGQGHAAALQARAVQSELNMVARSLRQMGAQRTNAIVETLLTAKQCYVTASRASYALAYYFHYVARMALPAIDLVPRHVGTTLDDLIGLGPEDCLIAITFAPYSTSTIQALRQARKQGARIVLISDSEVIAPGVEADHVLTVTTASLHPFGAYAGAMAVLDCLLSHLIEAGGTEARQRIEAYEALRQDSGAYWTGAKLPQIRS